MASKRLRTLVEDALDTPGAVRRVIKGPIILNKHSLNIKFNRTLTTREKARLTRELKRHLESGNTRIKVRFIGKVKVGINRNGDKRKVLNPLTRRRLVRGGKRYRFLTGKRGYREFRGILLPPEVSNNKRDVRIFMNQFAPRNDSGDRNGTETVVTPISVNAKRDTPVPEKVPVTLYNSSGKVVNKMAPGVVPVVYTNISGKPVKRGTPGAVPVVYTNGRGGFVSPTTPGAVPISLKDVPSLRAIAEEVNKTLVRDRRSIFKKLTNAFKGSLPKEPKNNSKKGGEVSIISTDLKKKPARDRRSIFKKLTNAFKGSLPKEPKNNSKKGGEVSIISTDLNKKLANLTKMINNARRS